MPRTDQKFFFAREHQHQRERALQAVKGLMGRFFGFVALGQVIRHQMRNDFGICFSLKPHLMLGQFVFEFCIILDNAIMHDGDFVGRVRMGVVLGRLAVRRPAGVTNTDMA